MSKHRSEDYKITTVKYYLENAYNKDAYKDYVKKESTLKRKQKIIRIKNI